LFISLTSFIYTEMDVDPVMEALNALQNGVMDLQLQIGEEQEEDIVVPHPLPFGEAWERADPMDQYRFDWDEINEIADSLRLPEVFVLDNGSVASKIQGLCVVLHRLSFPRRFTDAAALFGRSKSVMSRIFNQVADTIYQDWKHLLLFDHVRLTPEYLEQLAAAVREQGGALDNCWGFLDGTHIKICRPGDNQDLLYSGHKKQHSMKYQCVATPDGMIVHLGGPFPGCQHDSSILADSRLLDILNVHSHGHGGREMTIYGDEGYARRGRVLSPFRGRTLTQEQLTFNSEMRRPRLCVEWAFAHMANHWVFIKHSHNLRMQLSPIGRLYPLCALFSNIQRCIGRRTSTGGYYNMPPPTLHQYLTTRQQWEENRLVNFAHPAFVEGWEQPDEYVI
jgi:hypothetical protein